jgi:hypothetical protein
MAVFIQHFCIQCNPHNLRWLHCNSRPASVSAATNRSEHSKR